jgi:maleate cis-trans isomerase
VTAISPYPEAVDAAEHRFFAEGGVDCIASACLGITDGLRLAEPEPAAIFDLALGAWDPQSDGLMVACLNFRSHPIIDALEARIRKPVVTSTQAVLWHLLRLDGVKTPIPASAACCTSFDRNVDISWSSGLRSRLRGIQQESGGSRVNNGYPRPFLVVSYQAL